MCEQLYSRPVKPTKEQTDFTSFLIRHVKRPRKSSAQRVTSKWFPLTTKSQEIREMDDTRKIQSEKLGSKMFYFSSQDTIRWERRENPPHPKRLTEVHEGHLDLFLTE